MGFWEGERCEYCDGLIIEKKVSLSRKVEGKHVIIENVPAGVCTECGTRYYAANVLKTVEENYEDLRCLREAKEAERDAPTIGMAELKKKMRKRTRSLR